MTLKRASKYWLIILLIIPGALFCFFNSPGADTSAEEETAQRISWEPGRPLPLKDLKIGVIHIDEYAYSGYSYSHELGLRAMQDELGIDDRQIIRKMGVQDTDRVSVEHAIHECIAEGANLIIATSSGYMDICEKLAEEYPGVIFANAGGHKFNSRNFSNFYGKLYQARYLSGMAAGLRTSTGKIGFVTAAGKENSLVTGGVNAFALGVESVTPWARVYIKTTYRWYDPRGEAEAANKLIALGCDVIAQHCDTVGPQVEAQKSGAWGIGYNSDMKPYAPGAVITSVVWDWGVYYKRLIRSILDGSFSTAPYMGDMRDGLVRLTPIDESLLPRSAAQPLADARAKIESGESAVFEGELETNDGRIMGKAGQAFSDAQITDEMNWYYRNVVEHTATSH